MILFWYLRLTCFSFFKLFSWISTPYIALPPNPPPTPLAKYFLIGLCHKQIYWKCSFILLAKSSDVRFPLKIFLGKICQNFGKKCPVRLFPGEFVTPLQNISKYKEKRSEDQPSISSYFFLGKIFLSILRICDSWSLRKWILVSDSFWVIATGANQISRGSNKSSFYES